jgi:carboxyl-terminal processing protease
MNFKTALCVTFNSCLLKNNSHHSNLFETKMRSLLLAVIMSVFVINANAQTQVLNKAADNAFILTRIVSKYHIEPKPVDKNLSYNLFDHLIKTLDEERMFFIKEDIDKLQAYRMRLDDEIMNRRTNFLQLLSGIYQMRVMQVDTMIDAICKQPFNFNTKEIFTVTEDTSFTLNANAQHAKIAKIIKRMMLHKMALVAENSNTLSIDKRKKILDSVELVTRKKIQSRLNLGLKKMLQSPGGIPQSVGNDYCRTLAEYFDPHTNYFPLTEKENFESELGGKPLQFGFQLHEDDNGVVTIGKLAPGSPAFKSGQLNKGDKIIALQWQGKEEIDVSEASREEVSEMLNASNHDQVTFTIKKTDGTIRKVVLQKEKAENNNEEDKVKSFVLKGASNIGFISLPAFYTDWESNNLEDHGCANDVAREILKLKKENISGLIIDLRFNGGGSMQEAVELAGIFIDAGPVGQVKSRSSKVHTLMDVNRGTMYDGPLLFLVNGYSASASEILAATMQDYNRALIVGSPTYGKATAQIVLPLDTVAISNGSRTDNVKADNYLKITVERLYRITGKTAQFTGVIPDVRLPDVLEINPRREADNPFALQPTNIDANKYYKPYAPLPVDALQAKAKRDIDTSSYFIELKNFAAVYKSLSGEKDVSLSLNEVLAERKKIKERDKLIPEEKTISPYYVVSNHSFDEQRLLSDDDLKSLNAEWKKVLQKDPYIKVAYDLLSSGIK